MSFLAKAASLVLAPFESIMPRTKQTIRKSTGGKSCYWPQCYQQVRSGGDPPARQTYSCRNPDAKTRRSKSSNSSTRFPLFSKLPTEIRTRIWGLSAEEPRIVTVRTHNRSGLRGPAPPLLHACSESRAVGLKHYALCFSGLKPTQAHVPARTYLNFDRDTIYFASGWNDEVTGPWSCISHLPKLVNTEDLQRVKYVGFDLSAKACSKWAMGNHLPSFTGWTGLETLYLGLEEPSVSSASQREFCELMPEEYSSFLQCYRNVEYHGRLLDSFDDAAAIELIKSMRRFVRNVANIEKFAKVKVCLVRVVDATPP